MSDWDRAAKDVAAVWKRRRNRKRRKPGVFEAMRIQEERKQAAKETRARNKAAREAALALPSLGEPNGD